MTDHQGLTDEQIELLRSLPSIHNHTAQTKALEAGGWMVADHEGSIHANAPLMAQFVCTPAADVLLATLDHHTTKAKEDERRRIVDELDGLLDAPDPSNAGTIGTQFDKLKIGLGSFIDRLEAATQSTPKGENE